MGTTLTTLNRRLDEILARIKANADEREVLGRELLALKPEYAHGKWLPALRERTKAAGVAQRTAQFYMQCAKEPAALAKQQASNRDNQRKVRANVQHVAHLHAESIAPLDQRPDDRIAVRQMVAFADKAHKSLLSKVPETRGKFRMYRNSAFANFQALIERSNLPQITGMTPDQIIEEIKKL